MNIIDNSIGENEIINLIQVDCLEFPDFRLFYRMTVILQPYQKKKPHSQKQYITSVWDSDL